MLDIQFITAHTDVLQMAISKRGMAVDIKKLLKLDAERKNSTNPEEKIALIEKWKKAMMAIPNISDISVPAGNTPEQHSIIHTHGEVRRRTRDVLFWNAFLHKDNQFPVTDTRDVYVLSGTAALWYRAIQRAYEAPKEVVTPLSKMRKSASDQLLATAGFSESAAMINAPLVYTLMLLARQELSIDALPKNVVLESLIDINAPDTTLCSTSIVPASHMESVQVHEAFVHEVEDFLENLGVAYRTKIVCAGLLELSEVKTTLVEVYIPSDDAWVTVSYASYHHDFLARRFGITYSDTEKSKRYVHTVYQSGLLILPVLRALVEQTTFDSRLLTVPNILRERLHGLEHIELELV